MSESLDRVETLEQQREEQDRVIEETTEKSAELQRENDVLATNLQALIDGLRHTARGNSVGVTLEPNMESAGIARFMSRQEGVEVTEGPDVFRIESDGPVLVFDMNKIARSVGRMQAHHLETEMMEMSTRYGHYGRMVRIDDM
jgi:uncharacterized coiled-coil protein SlyX